MPHLRRLQAADDVLPFALGLVDDDLDRVPALDRTTGCRATSAHKLAQLGTQVVVERLVKAHPHQAALVRSQAEPTVAQDGDMHAPADQPSRAIGATQAAAPSGVKGAPGVRGDVDIRYPGGFVPRVRQQGAQSNRNTHDGLLVR
ncbi:MAG: hypothetical protein QOJ85_2503 [Solirubrobacteraceae bacterium]|nr:hypothetical protein [Solirubrobacteraceae bacterium]